MLFIFDSYGKTNPNECEMNLPGLQCLGDFMPEEPASDLQLGTFKALQCSFGPGIRDLKGYR